MVEKRVLKTNVIYCGECCDVMEKEVPDNSVDLVYIDPPFFSGRPYNMIWGDKGEEEMFDDRWESMNYYLYGGKEALAGKKGWLGMQAVIEQCHRVLKPLGSMYLHCDPHANYRLRMLMNKIFCGNEDSEKNFQNEIIWHYNVGGASKNRFSAKHDTIFFYTKSNDYIFNTKSTSEPYREDRSDHFNLTDENGRKYRIRKIGDKEYRYYLDEGRIPHDVWNIDSINAVAKERLGYPTQKPEALLERIIKASSNKGDIVLDSMCGCGTTISVANKLGRKWIGIDISPRACEMMVKRLEYEKYGKSQKAEIKIRDIPIPPDIFEKYVINIVGKANVEDELIRKRKMDDYKFQCWAVRSLDGVPMPKGVDKGYDGYLIQSLSNPRVLIQVKRSDSIGRPVLDQFETTLEREKCNNGIVVAFSFSSGSDNEARRIELESNKKIRLITTREILTGEFRSKMFKLG